MNWLNENAGVLVFVLGVISLVLLGVAVYLLFYLKNRIAVQRLSFLGFFSTSLDTRKQYADLTIGNKTLNTVGITEIGLRNGKVTFNLTELYREKTGLPSDAKIVLGQRSSLVFRLSADELRRTVVTAPNGKKCVHGIRVYAVDLTGTLYQGKVNEVRRLLVRLVDEENRAGKETAKETAKQPEPAAPLPAPLDARENDAEPSEGNVFGQNNFERTE